MAHFWNHTGILHCHCWVQFLSVFIRGIFSWISFAWEDVIPFEFMIFPLNLLVLQSSCYLIRFCNQFPSQQFETLLVPCITRKECHWLKWKCSVWIRFEWKLDQKPRKTWDKEKQIPFLCSAKIKSFRILLVSRSKWNLFSVCCARND